MQIRVGFEMLFDCPQPVPMILNLHVHFSRASDLLSRDDLLFEPAVPLQAYRDSGAWDAYVPLARQTPVEQLPEEALLFLLGSRYCETDRLSETAWNLFGHAPEGWGRVQAICDFVHRHIRFGYEHARMTRSALEAWNEGAGVCRDYAHLAVAFCRCMNIPARYCTGFLGDIGVPATDAVAGA